MQLPIDRNFPEPIIEALRPFMTDLDLLPIRYIHPKMCTLPDRELIIGLHQHGFKSLITLDYKMLHNPSVLAAVMKTKLTIFAIEGVGHDPIRATGALLLDLPPAVRNMQSGKPGVYWMRPRAPQPMALWTLFEQAAGRHDQSTESLYQRIRVSDSELQAPVIDRRTDPADRL